MVLRKRSLVVLLIALIVSQFGTAVGSTRYLSLAVGHVAVFDDNVDDPSVYKVEYRFKPKTNWLLAPSIGAARSENEASFVFADLEKDFSLHRHWVFDADFWIGLFR